MEKNETKNEKGDNLALWNRVEKTNPEFVKSALIGERRITVIDPQYQMKNATYEFGSYGGKWGLRNIEWGTIEIGNTILGTLSAVFFTPDREVETGNSIKISYKTSKGYIKVDEDYRKKLITNTISKELSRLGFNADVFMGKFDDERYVQQQGEEFKKRDIENKSIGVREKLEECKTIDELKTIWADLPVDVRSALSDTKEDIKNKLTKPV